MKDLLIRCLLIGSLLAAGSPCNQVHSCYSSPEWHDTRAVFFNPDLGEDDTGGLKPYFYSNYYLFPTDYDGYQSAGADNSEQDYRRNCREWQTYLGGKIDPDDIYEVLYGTDADAFYTAFKTQSLSEFLPGNTFLKTLQKPAHADALRYLFFAKRFEFRQFENENDPWGDTRNRSDVVREDSLAFNDFLQESARELAQTNNPFLRQRWAYQRINTLYYSEINGAADSIARTFSSYFNIKEDMTVLLPWALLKVAETNANAGESNYQFALVFDRCQSKRLRAVQLFQSKIAEKALPYAKNPQEKGVILAMRAMQNPGRGLADLQSMARLCSESRYLPLLLTREINKVEDWTMTKRLTGIEPWHAFEPDFDWDENYSRKMDRWQRINAEKDRQYLHALRVFVADMARRGGKKSPHQAFLQLALAHLYYMEQRPADAWRVLQSTATESDARRTLQKNIEEILLLPQRSDVRRVDVQAALYQRIEYVLQHTDLLGEPAQQISRMYLALSHAFLAKKDIVTAGLLFGRASKYTGTEVDPWWSAADARIFYDNLASMRDLEKVEALLTKKDKTPFEQLITSPLSKAECGNGTEWSFYSFDPQQPQYIIVSDQIHELMGTFALRDGQLKRAVAEFEKIGNDYWDEYYGIWSVDICGSTGFIAADSLPPLTNNNKYRIVRKMLDLQEEALRNPAKRAENYYLLGNAWFHCSYWGVADDMLTLHSSHSETDAPDPYRRGPTYLVSRPDWKRYGHMYYRCSRAAAYFRKSLAARPNPELAVRAYYMLAECDRRDRWMSMRRRDESEGGVASPMFKTWAKRYGKTEAFRECLEGCPDLKTYLGL